MANKEIESEQSQVHYVHNQDLEFDQLVASVPECILDSRRYYWPNFSQPQYVHHHRFKFVYSFQLPTLTQSRTYYIASFAVDLGWT